MGFPKQGLNEGKDGVRAPSWPEGRASRWSQTLASLRSELRSGLERVDVRRRWWRIWGRVVEVALRGGCGVLVDVLVGSDEQPHQGLKI